MAEGKKIKYEDFKKVLKKYLAVKKAPQSVVDGALSAFDNRKSNLS